MSFLRWKKVSNQSKLLCTIGEHENDCNPLIEENPDEDLKPSDVVRIGKANLISDLNRFDPNDRRPAVLNDFSINNRIWV